MSQKQFLQESQQVVLEIFQDRFLEKSMDKSLNYAKKKLQVSSVEELGIPGGIALVLGLLQGFIQIFS